MKVVVNPAALVDGKPITLRHPVTDRVLCDSTTEPVTLSAADLADKRIRRLLPKPGRPGGIEGGLYGDLVPWQPPDAPDPKPPKQKSAG